MSSPGSLGLAVFARPWESVRSHLRCSPVTDTRPSAALRAQTRPRSSSLIQLPRRRVKLFGRKVLVPGLAKAARPFDEAQGRLWGTRAKQKCIDSSLGVRRKAKDSLSQDDKNGRVIAQNPRPFAKCAKGWGTRAKTARPGAPALFLMSAKTRSVGKFESPQDIVGVG
jgi:hypothetical protein